MKRLLQKYLILSALISCGYKASAQQEMTLHFMDNVYESYKTNPAFKPKNTVAFQFVNLYFSLYNTGFQPRDLYNANLSSSPGDYIMGKLKNINYVGNTISSDLFSFRVRIRKVDLTFNATQNMSFRMGYPKDLFALAWYGNGDNYFLGNNRAARLDGLGANAISYTELGAGFSHTVNDKFTYGIRYKFLIGQAVLNTVKSEGSLYTDPNSYAITGTANLTIQTANLPSLNNLSAIPKDYGSNALDVIKHMNNKGSAIDLGFTYKPTPKLSINVSVVNLGSITWKDSAYTFSTNGAKSLTFNGAAITNLGKSIDSLKLDKFLDTARKVFGLNKTKDAFTTALTPLIYVSGMYNFNDNNKVGVLVAAQYLKDEDVKVRANYAVGYTKTFGRKRTLDFSLNYSVQNNTFLNFGVGVALRYFYIFESYFVTDNIVGFVAPAYANNYGFRLGTNIIFGRRHEHKKKEDEPVIAAVVMDKDTDKDGVPDALDLCPTIPGSSAAKGCPDMDNDSIPDILDSCKTIAGLRKFNGCPDTDHDGIPDYLDRCPKDSGSVFFKGCPDTDGDSIPDIEDSCRTIKGPKKWNGCPDSDGDGIIDSKDACPFQPGPLMFNGCPDTDGDSIPDNLDACPLVRGVRESRGCPKGEAAKAQLTREEEEVISKVFVSLEFENGKSIIKESSYASLDALADLLTKKPTFTLKITGYTDNVGKKESNQKLSQQRADAVKEYLGKRGISVTRLTATGLGPVNPIASNKTAEGRAKNRRVEFLIME